ncbi:hypothetical protein ACNOYE_23325 [Nannocystaceae bacterium ST9]
MKLGLPALVPLLPWLTGCVVTIGDGDVANDEADTGEGTTTTSEGDSDDDVGTDSSGETTGTSTETDTGTSTDTGTDTTGTDTSTDSGTDTTTDTGTDTGSDTSTDTGTETGEEQEQPPAGYCGMSAGPVDPWMTLNQYGAPIVDAAPFQLECGGQGSWMFRFDVDLGGFAPDDKVIPINATMDVEGYNIGPNGHFAANMYNWFLGCCDDPEDYYNYGGYCYYGNTFTLFPPDAIADLSVLDGLIGTLHVTMSTPEGDVELTIDTEIWAVYEPEWELCLYEYYDGLPPLEIGPPIPLP